MTPTIRDATPSDMVQVHEMIGHLARHHGDEIKITVEELQLQIFYLRRGRILVAAEEDGLVGHALILERPNLVTGSAAHEINHLFVVEWRRRAGIGRALIAAAQRLSAEAEALLIGTHPDNLGAQRAYRDMGMEELPASGPRFKVRI